MKHLNYQKGIARIITVIILAVILIVGGAYYFKQQQTKQISNTSTVYGSSKEAIVLVQDATKFWPTLGTDYYQLEINSSFHLFGKGNGFDLGKYLGKTIKIVYREEVGHAEGEQQIVLVDSITNAVDATANWKTFTYPGNAFTIQYPPNWTAHQGVLNGDATGLALSAPEGSVGISENVIFSGTCDQSSPLTNPLQIYHKILYGCYSSNPNGSIGWAKYVKIVSPTMKYGIQAVAASPGEKNKNTILQVLSTLKFNNPVANYLNGSELQAETDAQRQNIATALNDALNLSENQLKEKRYKDYSGKANQWDLPTLISRHFVPDAQKTLGDNFLKDVKEKDAQEQIKQILKKYFQSNAL